MKLLVTVDSIDEGLASLLLRNGVNERPLGVFPLEALPEDVSAGDILTISFEKNDEETDAAKERVRKIHEMLRKGSK
ncbi:MAG: DUF3006 domain-containing protein [Methanocorpusculum sp.]|nr:DUF3006 domain-containing protein [Methanocorpusculum sp.]